MSPARKVKYPYIPDGKKILYVGLENAYMRAAKAFARKNSLDEVMPGAAVIVKDHEIIGIGANGSDYHKKNPCKRKELRCKTGEGYELCEGCHPRNHSEPSAIRDAAAKGGGMPHRVQIYIYGDTGGAVSRAGMP